MRVRDQEIGSLADLIRLLPNDMPENTPVWFRGQTVAAWNLEPSLTRHGGIQAEMTLVKRFKQNALPLISDRPEGEWEWLFLMQHQGLPTRLLDWTESALVGLYFAVSGSSAEHDDEPGTLWALLPISLNQQSKWQTEFDADIPGFGEDEDLDQYLPSKVEKQRITLPPIAAIALRNTPRMQMQQGVFTVSHRELSVRPGTL